MSKSALERACERVKEHALDGRPYGLAISKASEETGVRRVDICAEFTRRRAASREAAKKKEAYKCTPKF